MNNNQPSWRAFKKIHPVAKLFPAFEPDVLQEMANDIESSGGLKLPVRTCVDDEGDLCVFEGVNRLDALELAGHKLVDDQGKWTPFATPCIQYVGRRTDAQIAMEVISLNIRRRHLTKQQQVELIDAVLKVAKVHSAKMARSVGGKGGGSTKDHHKTAVVGLAAGVGI